ARLLRTIHFRFPTVPMFVVAKEISLEDVRLGLEKMPGRFYEHPATVLVVTNLNYADAPRLEPASVNADAPLNWQELRLTGNSTHEYADEIEALGPVLTHGWQTRPSAKTGNPVYERPTVLVIYREDHEFLLQGVIPRPGRVLPGYDFILASQPWRARMPAEFKARTVLAPLARNLAPDGRLLAIQSTGGDPALELTQAIWPGESPFQVNRPQLLAAPRRERRPEADNFVLDPLSDAQSVFRYQMHTLPSEIGDRIGTSTLFAAWNAAIYVNQIEDERLDAVVNSGAYLAATQEVLRRHGGLWFNDETFVVTRNAERAAAAQTKTDRKSRG